jgi:hypothetical protein
MFSSAHKWSAVVRISAGASHAARWGSLAHRHHVCLVQLSRAFAFHSTQRILLTVSCPICEKRKAQRFCPAKGEKICAVCCGKEREVAIDCPMNCTYLIAAHRYEDEHRRALPADTPLLDVQIPRDIVHIHQQLMAAFAFTIAKFCVAHRDVTDTDVLAAVEAFAETNRTLMTGIYYEKLPDGAVRRELYSALTNFVAEIKQAQAQQGNSGALKDADIFYLLVFLYRMGLLRTNGRLRSRRYIEFLRNQFPEAQELKREESRIIMP